MKKMNGGVDPSKRSRHVPCPQSSTALRTFQVHRIIEIARHARDAFHTRDMHPNSDAVEALRNVGSSKIAK